ncbi:uncharacterized protein LOC124285050 [Haliotis rubra]|uniref:uncharacterized protein LOC124285050 n=1 Tax=Haliotis rubra TaxID=36100 RepID=UPI001EE62B81|nr:uncharacterized protein LOC124285050 [Haliotis rubra]
MLFHVVPEDIFRERASYSRPCYYQRNPRCQQQQLANMGFLNDILRPLMVMSHNNPQSESCHGENCQRVTRRGTQKGERPSQKRQPESMTASLDFRGFSADEIKVKVTDNSIVVCGRHDGPSNSFRVTRRLPLPPGVDKTGVTCRYVDGEVILEIPASAKHSVEDKQEREEGEKKAEHKEKRVRSDPARTSDTDDDEYDDGGMEGEKEVQAALQEGMKHLFSTMFGLPVVERKEKKVLSNGSPDKEEETTEQTTTDPDREEPRPEDDNKTTDGSFDKQMDVEEEKGQEEDTCLMLKYDEKPSLRHDPSDIARLEEQTTAVSVLPEQTTDRNTDEDEEVVRLMSDGDEDAESILVKADKNLPVSSSSQDFEIRFDLSNYKPEDIRVVVSNGDVTVEAERESKCDGYSGYSETETLQRRIRLPDKVDQSMLTSVLNAEGEMTIQAPFLSQTISGKEEQTVPIVWE